MRAQGRKKKPKQLGKSDLLSRIINNEMIVPLHVIQTAA